jgi:dipeptidyl aminopeptidase/acylaminoacyl peptidase
MLRQLSGQEHLVITAFALLNLPGRRHRCESEKTRVTFRNLPDEEIERVVATDGSAARDLGVLPRSVHSCPRFSPDGATIAAAVEERFDATAPRVRLRVYDAATGEGRDLATGWDRWPHVEAFTADGRAVVVTAHDRGEVPVFRVDVTTGAVDRVTAPASGGTHEAITVARDGRIVGVRSRTVHPPEPFICDVAPGSTPRVAATLSGFDAAEGEALVRVERMVVRAEDGTEIDSIVVSPRAATGPAPALLWIHGGPMHHWADGWHYRWCPLVAASAGYVVALPNPRGSTGYGQHMTDGIWANRWGDECYGDLMRVTDALERRPDVDARRVAAMGGSFGGYMANWIGGQTDRFRALVTHASLFDLRGFFGATDHPAWFALELGGAPWAQPDAIDKCSPHRFVSRWKTPALVIHGEKDYRVAITDGLALFDALVAHGVDAELLVFPDENHWIKKPRNVIAWYEGVLAFLAARVG